MADIVDLAMTYEEMELNHLGVVPLYPCIYQENLNVI